MKCRVLIRCVVLLGFAADLFAQGVGASGDIKGSIRDSSGAVMQNVAVAIVETGRGMRRTAVTDSGGQYRLTGMSPANYEVSAAMPGFESQVQKNVVLNLGETVVVDFRVKQTPQSGLSFYGSNGRGNNITVDGGEANDDAGGVRLNLSQDAVQEFQINRSNYSAELGNASAASVNIVTKSGTNTMHAGLYSFFRNDAMDARDPFDFSPALVPAQFSLTASGTPIKNALNRQQFGGTLGFPLKKEKTFLFVGYEGLRSDAEDSVPLLTHSNICAPTPAQAPILSALANDPGNPMVPCISNFANGGPPTFLPAATCAFGLQSILTVDPTAAGNPFVSPGHLALNQFVVNQFEKEGGLFPFATRQHEVSGRLDHRFNTSNQAFLHYTFAHLNESDPDVQALIGFSRGTSVLNWDSTLQGSWFHQFSANSVNEARLQWNWYQFNVDTNDRGGPGLDVQGYGFFGRGIFLPSHTTARRYEFADNLTLVRGHHTMRTGFYDLIRGNNTTSDTFFAR